MTKTVKSRLDDLERAVNPSSKRGPPVLCDLCDPDGQELTPEEKARRIAEAEAQAGPDGAIIVLVYETETERGNRDETN